ncbi:hypothetical protein [Streptomyces sp. NEAU-NA10]|uniref:hypothetical protein n=1 Tax=Streptomyces sp. NEAU-NA10 TaxID=3416050 RepID=UPI003CC62D9C
MRSAGSEDSECGRCGAALACPGPSPRGRRDPQPVADPQHVRIGVCARPLDEEGLVGAAELAWQPVLDDPLGALSGV